MPVPLPSAAPRPTSPKRRRSLRSAAMAVVTALAVTVGAGLIAGAPAAASAAEAAVPTTLGSEFFVTFDDNTIDGPPTLLLYLSGPNDSTVSILWPDGASSTESVLANTVTTVDATAHFAAFQNTAVESQTGRAAHITATSPVTIYGLNLSTYTSDAFVSLPVESLGIAYRALTFGSSGSRLSVVATGAGTTTVTVTSQTALNAHPAGTPYDITLAQGEVYTVTGTGTDVSGTLITADKKIGVTGSTFCVNIGFSACDHVVEVMPPITAWGMDFLLPDSINSQYRDSYRVLANEDGTVLTLGDTVIATLNAGEVHTFGGAREGSPLVQVLTSNKPVLVLNGFGGGDYAGQTGDPATTLVAPTRQLLKSYTVATPASGFAVNTLTVIAKTDNVGTVTLNNVAIDAAEFTPVASTAYSVARLLVAPGSYAISAQSGVAVYVEGFNSNNSYAYSGGYANVNLIDNPGGSNPLTSATITGDPVVGQILTAVVDEALPLTDPSYIWMRDGVAIDGATSADYTLVGADLNKVISVAVTGTNAQSEPETATSPGTAAIVAGPFRSTAVPTVTGHAVVNQTLTASVPDWSPVASEVTVQWMRDGVAIDGATALSYLLVAEDEGTTISVAVTGSSTGYVTATTVSAMSIAVTPAASNTTPAQTLTAGDGGMIAVSGVDFVPGETVEVWLHSTPVLLGTLVAAADGTVTGSFALPAATPAGVHHIVLIGLLSGSVTSADITVTAPAVVATSSLDTALPTTGINAGLTGWVALLLALSGLALVLARRRRVRARN
ncbi:LPXTG cell wall anchor domain-containing protein [Cryobacterium sp. PH29-G1]|uniref:LPXTG cell wall anchor domain-containing protein n=1 Tax=Cryobacterium sp. PH29-G1 TaxID=3046211 RepID=UPI0024BA4ED9|nr:LPXTG cell wall anchor domain-containing protein [Cryobacterium sp. PH29-G1]MDJ0350657.1 LPXTG cell wall anchor domain-containing protein [Cryobacterium sp. PH29-G1]